MQFFIEVAKRAVEFVRNIDFSLIRGKIFFFFDWVKEAKNKKSK